MSFFKRVMIVLASLVCVFASGCAKKNSSSGSQSEADTSSSQEQDSSGDESEPDPKPSQPVQGDKIKVLCAHSDLEESEMVANRMLDLHTFKDVPWSQIAILYRTNAQSRPLEEALRKRGLPYKIYGGLSFYQRKEIKDVIAYFRMSVNPNDEEAFKRIINYPARGIGQTTVGKILSVAMENGVSLWSVISNPADYHLDVNSGTAAKLSAFKTMLESFMADAATQDAQQLSERIVNETGIMRELQADTTVEGIGRKDNVEELLANIAQFCLDRKEEGNERCFMTDYLSEVSLMTDQDNETDEDLEKVTLMTVHAAKGLEFDAVFIVGLEENLFPSDMSGDSEREIEEERRLFYVAMTRARKYLTLLFATTRFKYGSVDFCTPSRFLKDIDPRYLSAPGGGLGTVPFGSGNEFHISKPKLEPKGTVPGPRFERKTEFQAKPIRKPWEQGRFQKVTENMLKDTAPAQSSALKVGSVIEHERFGIGSVLEVEGSGGDTKARIKFLNVGEKTLLLKFARYKILK